MAMLNEEWLRARQERLRGSQAVYYGRVSDPVTQPDGMGLPRQRGGIEWGEEELGVNFVLKLEDTRSGYTGSHRLHGNWGKIIEMVDRKDKRMKPGTVLVVDFFRVMGREEVIEIALPQFLKLIKHGIKIAIYQDKMIYDKEILKTPMGPMMLIQAIINMGMAHDGSAEKAYHRRDGNKKRRARGEMVGFLPFHLKRKKPGETPEYPWTDKYNHIEFWVHEFRERVILLIWELYLDEKLGCKLIADELNKPTRPNVIALAGKAGKIPTFTSHFNRKEREVSGLWSAPTISRILHAHSVRGNYDPGEVVDGRWEGDVEIPRTRKSLGKMEVGRLPILISEARGEAALLKLRKNNPRLALAGGNRGRTFTNLFSNGTAICVHCGSPAYHYSNDVLCKNIVKCSSHGASHGCEYVINYPYPILEEQVFATVRFMIEERDPIIEIADDDDDSELAVLLRDLNGMQDDLEDLYDLKKQDTPKNRGWGRENKKLKKNAIAEQEKKIKQQELLIAEAQPITNSQLEDMLAARKQSQIVEDDEERKMIRLKLAHDFKDMIDIEISGTPRVKGRCRADRQVEIYWKPCGGEQLMFRWKLAHLMSNDPASFDGIYAIDPETGDIIEGPLTDYNTTILDQVTAAINALILTERSNHQDIRARWAENERERYQDRERKNELARVRYAEKPRLKSKLPDFDLPTLLNVCERTMDDEGCTIISSRDLSDFLFEGDYIWIDNPWILATALKTATPPIVAHRGHYTIDQFRER